VGCGVCVCVCVCGVRACTRAHAWVTQLVKRPNLDLSVLSSSPTLGMEPAWDSLSPSVPPTQKKGEKERKESHMFLSATLLYCRQ